MGHGTGEDRVRSGRLPGALATARWFEIRPAQNRKPATYRCPLCDQRLPALMPHMLLMPDGQPAGRRHAHRECVLAARAAGRLPTRAEWRAKTGARPPLWRRWLTAVRERGR